MNSIAIIENYLKMLGGEDNILYHHVFINSENNSVMVAIITEVSRNKYHLSVDVNGRKVVDSSYPTLKSAFRILRNLQA